MLAAGSLGFHNGADLFAGIFGIKIVKNLANYGKTVVSLGAVHRIVDGDEPHIVTRKDDFADMDKTTKLYGAADNN